MVDVLSLTRENITNCLQGLSCGEPALNWLASLVSLGRSFRSFRMSLSVGKIKSPREIHLLFDFIDFSMTMSFLSF
jgi:hypothetical protein